MKKLYKYLLMALLLFGILSAALVYATRDNRVIIENYTSINRKPKIRPDYCDTVIPPNIAPLNFLLQEKGLHYCVKISSRAGQPIEVFSKTGKIIIPEKPWHKLLNQNKGQELYFDVFVKTENNQWHRYQTITNKIAAEPIDGFLVYRRMRPLYSKWKEMGIYQRNLHSFDESVVLNNKSFKLGCVHCHTFLANNTDRMLMHVRSFNGPSMLLIENGKASNIDSRTSFSTAPMGYTGWHPSGKLIVFTVYKVFQFFHTTGLQVRDVYELDSALGYYLFDSKIVKTSPQLSKKDRLETYPNWTPDGRYLYFCSAPMLWPQEQRKIPEQYNQVKYDLHRISYDLETDTWGKLETVLSAEQTGLSIIQPRISPDGRFILFCMCQYSCFPAFQPSSDLYLMDLNTGRYERLACNSDQSESWHCWSSNNRWIVFSSKRGTGLFSKGYFSYIDQNGKAHKPFLLPQKDPTFYDSFTYLYQMPELIKTPIPVTGERLAKLIRSPLQLNTQIPVTAASPEAGPAYRAEPWQSGLE